MCDLLTIDGGTTNTRIKLVRNFQETDAIKINLGARAALNDAASLRQGVRQSVITLLERNGLNASVIRAVIASGMITSESGLMTVPHIPAPAGVKELAAAMKQVILPEISPITFFFVPGVKCTGVYELETDVMRGEETECVGLMEQLQFETGLLLLPGSHSKAICMKNGKIENFSTFLSGEMLAAIRENTILKASVRFDDVSLVEKSLRQGYEYCEQEGINKSLFKVRIMANFLQASPSEVYSFYCGVLLHDEIRNLQCSPFECVYIGGQTLLKRLMTVLLNAYSDKQIIELDDGVCENASCVGAIKLFQERNKLEI